MKPLLQAVKSPAVQSWRKVLKPAKDGVYTEAEYKAELIRKDQIGDYRPHTVTDLKNGYYYLVEVSAPAIMKQRRYRKSM